jgi:hypothetical protein
MLDCRRLDLEPRLTVPNLELSTRLLLTLASHLLLASYLLPSHGTDETEETASPSSLRVFIEVAKAKEHGHRVRILAKKLLHLEPG